LLQLLGFWSLRLNRDAVLVDIIRHSSSRWFTGPYGWVFANAEEIKPVRMRGAQGLFDFTLPGV
jgi:hypothetical protein